MKLRHVRIKNFRCFSEVELPVDDTTILIGENNSGKTALLEAIRKALPISPGGRREPFDQYDYHFESSSTGIPASKETSIELIFREDRPGEWPINLRQALDAIIQTDPHSSLNSIHLRLSSAPGTVTQGMTARWEFLNIQDQPLTGKGASPGNLARFLDYMRLVYLSALRDPSDEFSSRSQFWGPILRSLNISEAQAKSLGEELQKLNEALLVTAQVLFAG